MLKDINPNGQGDPQYFTEYNGKLYFYSDDGINGRELWITDGTSAGTQMLKNINPNGTSNYFLNPAFTEYNGKLYFFASDTSVGCCQNLDYQLWETDGTDAGTIKKQPTIASNFNPLGNSSSFTEFNGSLYFQAYYNSSGRELWKFTAPNVSVAEVMKRSIKMYPNPVNHLLYIETEQEITEIKLYTLTGQEVQTWQNQDNIDLSRYAKGVYFVKIQTLNGTETKKIIKE